MEGKFCLVYDGDFVGFVLAVVKEVYEGNRVLIETMDGTRLVRIYKDIYSEVQQDGCAYILKQGSCRLCKKEKCEQLAMEI